MQNTEKKSRNREKNNIKSIEKPQSNHRLPVIDQRKAIQTMKKYRGTIENRRKPYRNHKNKPQKNH